MDRQSVIKDLTSSENGISEEEAKKRRSQYGLNEIPKYKRASLVKLFFAQFKDLLILILIVAIIIELIVTIIKQESNYTEIIAIASFIIINSIIGLVTEYRSEKAMLSLKQYSAEKAHVIRPEGENFIDSKLLVPGDVISMEMGNKIPADGRLLNAMNLAIDESNLTGESKAVRKNSKRISTDVALGDRHTMVFSGTIATYGRGTAVIIGTGLDTQIGQIAQLMQQVKDVETPLQRKMGKVGFKLGVLIINICILVFIIGLLKASFIGQTINSTLIISFLLTAVALAVAAMPSGLPIVITTLLALGMREMAKEKVLVKRLKAVETLGSVNVICSDKTGTLTKNEMTVRKIYANKKIINVTGRGYAPEGNFNLNNQEKFNPLNDVHFELLLRIGALCGTSKVSQKEDQWVVVGDPTEGSLLTLAMKAKLDLNEMKEKFPKIGEIPFTSEQKRMTTIHKTPNNEVYAYVKGAPDVIIDRCNTIYEEGKIKEINHEERDFILKLNEELSSEQLRILAMACRPVEEHPDRKYEGVDRDLTFVGLVGMMDPPRNEVPGAIKICKRAGINVKMITGDHFATANAIAKEIHLISKEETQNTITGVNFNEKSKAEIEKTKIFARISPEHKLKVVKTLLERDYVVAVTGDGVNDAPALKNANIGVAMGGIGTDVAREASDMTLTDDNFATIISAIRRGRNIYENILKTIFYLLSCNIGEIMIIFVWILIGSQVFVSSGLISILPLLPLQILWINLITDSLPAISLAKEPDNPRLMKHPPKHIDEPVFTARFTVNILILGLLICIGTLFMFQWGINQGKTMWITGMESSEELAIIERQIYRYATTLSFMTVTMFENWNIFCTRSLNKSIFNIKSQNYYTYIAIFMAILLQALVVYVPVFWGPFHTYPLGVIDWILLITISSSIIWVTEGYKLLWNWWNERRQFK